MVRIGSRYGGRKQVVLAVIVIGSYAWSIVQTSAHPAAAYFSPFTRAWELALPGARARCMAAWRRGWARR